MAQYIAETYSPQGVHVVYQDFSNSCLPQHNQIYVEPVIQQHQVYRDPALQQQNYAEHPIPQNPQVYKDLQKLNLISKAEDTQQHTICREAHQEEQPPSQPAVQAQGREIFNKTCLSNSDLAAHYAGPTGEKAHICDVCHICFAWKSQLRRHYLIHTGDKPHVCDKCHKGFARKSGLRNHYLIHTGDKPYKCVVCSKAFTDKTTWRRHNLIHAAQKPYVCDICQRGFIQKITLRQHYLIHSREKNHICEICNKRFDQKSALCTHHCEHSTHREGKRKKGKGKKNAEVATLQEDQITKAIAEYVAGVEQQLKEIHILQKVIPV